MAIVTAHVAAVQQLYVAYFNRPADYAGLDYWTNVVAAQNGSTAAVSAAFAAEAEYKTEYANLSSAEVVNKVYQNLFGRAAEDAGKKYWADLLDSKQITIDKVVAEVAKGAQTSDAEAYENKVAGATAFTAALDTKAEQDGYRGPEANAAAKTFISGITTDASLATATAPAALAATVAKVVAEGTPFTLAGAMSNLLAAEEAKSEYLAQLAEDNEDVADLLDSTPTDAEIEDAVGTIVTGVEADIDAILPGFSGASVALQAALISDEEDALAATLAAQKKTLATATTEVGKVANLAAAIAASTEAAEAAEEAATTAGLAQNAEDAALANLDTLNTGAVVLNAGTSVTVNGVVKIEFDADDEEYKLASGVTETNTKGVTQALAALNANLVAQAASDDADEAAADALLAADILDTSDDGTLLDAVGDAMVFTKLGTNPPTYAQIANEQALFEARIEDLDAVAGGAGAYQTALGTLATGVAAAATSTAADTLLDAAVAKGYITAADASEILEVYGTGAANVTVAVVEENSWLGRSEAFTDAVDALTTAEGLEAGIGNLAQAQIDADDAINGTGGTQELIQDLADAVEAYEAAMALQAGIDAADDAIAAAVEVITEEGYAAPVTLADNAIALSTSADDIFVVSGSVDASIRSFGVFGQDTIYVGTGLKYNNTVIGSGTGETDLDEAGDNAVLEFFLNETATGVELIVENKTFGSESGADADQTIITLVGVDLEDITVANGFITVGTPAA